MFKFIGPAFLAFLLWYMQIIDSKVNVNDVEQYGAFGALWTSFKFYLYTYRPFVGAAASALIVFFSLRDSVYRPRRESQSIVHNQLKEIMDDCFPKKTAQVRLTVFKKADWAEAFIHYLYHKLFQGMLSDGPKSWKGFWTGVPNIFSNHLIIYSRIGTPSQTVLSTTFRLPDDEEKAEGFVGLAWKSQEAVRADLPDINSIAELRTCSKIEDLDAKAQAQVRDYMSKGNISSFGKLQSIHRFSKVLWATTIYDAGNEPWGVLILDSSEKDSLTKEKEGRLQKYKDNIRKIILRARERTS